MESVETPYFGPTQTQIPEEDLSLKQWALQECIKTYNEEKDMDDWQVLHIEDKQN